MTRIKYALCGILIALLGSWSLADTWVPEPFTYFSFRRAFVQVTGVLAIGAMSIAMLLALRPRWLEKPLDGLDKMYRLHKWLGITALVSGVLHWWFALGTKWMVGWGWLERPVRTARSEEYGVLRQWLNSQRDLADTLGEWGFYIAAIMIALALIHRFPYRLFGQTHRWIALIYLALAFHSLVRVRFEYWSQPVGWITAVLLVLGCVAACISLFRRIGATRKVEGRIGELTHFPRLDVLQTRIEVPADWPGHAPGQFAFVTYDSREGAHPYTIASAWNPAEPSLTFIIKALGDHTRRLKALLKPGQSVMIEGPYGCFDFEDDRSRQIWIGAGIGITPFIARMQDRAAGRHRDIDVTLFHPTAVFEQPAIERLEADARAAGIELHVLTDQHDGRLDGARIRQLVPDWEQASIWFCGPAAFGRSLRADFIAHGLPARHFHQELFQMR
ncbi:MAG: ferric reductase-like transmembrane domain-containing protein [Lautropia sp.]|nr:ferric reductase-like transmembrane domain-containing protein [Lautropia sp.]